MSPRHALLLVAAAAAWAPEAEFTKLHGTSQATWRGRVDAELARSLGAIPQRTNVDEASAAVAQLLNHNFRRRAVVLLFGSVFVDRTFLPGEKVRSLVATLLSSHRLGVELKNVVFLHQPAADGGRRGNCIAPGLPMTVIAKGRGYKQCGILIPNPYFGSSDRKGQMRTKPGDLATWHRQVSSLRTFAAARPFAMRDGRAMWRGKCLNHENRANGTAENYTKHRKEMHRRHAAGDFSHGHRQSFNQHRRLNIHTRKKKLLRHRREQAERVAMESRGHCNADIEGGNRARFLAAAMSAKRPDLFDIKCSFLDPPRNFSCVRDPTERLKLEEALRFVDEEALRLVDGAPSSLVDKAWISRADFALYKVLVNLPGETTGSYSRNLNHLWATGAAVAFWEAPYVEWYYPALRNGITHESIDYASAIQVLDGLHEDPARVASLVENARRVDAELVCASCMADYYGRVVDGLRARMRYDLVLDDAGTVLQIAEEAGACELVEARTLPDKHGAFTEIEPGDGLCDVLRRVAAGAYESRYE